MDLPKSIALLMGTQSDAAKPNATLQFSKLSRIDEVRKNCVMKFNMLMAVQVDERLGPALSRSKDRRSRHDIGMMEST